MVASPAVSFRRGTAAVLAGSGQGSPSLTDGQILLATDTAELFFDVPDESGNPARVHNNAAMTILIHRPMYDGFLFPEVTVTDPSDGSTSLIMSSSSMDNAEYFLVRTGDAWTAMPTEGIAQSGTVPVQVAVDMSPFIAEYGQLRHRSVAVDWYTSEGTKIGVTTYALHAAQPVDVVSHAQLNAVVGDISSLLDAINGEVI